MHHRWMSMGGLEAKVNLSQNNIFYHLLTRYNGWPISLRRLLYGDELLSLTPVEAITDLFKLFPSLFSAWKDPYYLGRSCLRSNPKHGGSWDYHVTISWPWFSGLWYTISHTISVSTFSYFESAVNVRSTPLTWMIDTHKTKYASRPNTQ